MVTSEDLDAATYYLEHLRPIRSSGDPETSFEISLLEVELLVKQQEYERALGCVSASIAALKDKSGAGPFNKHLLAAEREC